LQLKGIGEKTKLESLQSTSNLVSCLSKLARFKDDKAKLIVR